jgi:hypothetical protein
MQVPVKARSAEIAKVQAPHIEAAPALPGIGAMLDKYMWVHTISHTPIMDLVTGHKEELLRIEGFIKPDPGAPDISSLRRGFCESLEAIVAILDEAGARWGQHPDFTISGKVRTERDGSQSFTELEARIDFTLLAGA